MYVTVSKPRCGCHGVPFGSPGAYSTSPIWSMCTNGSSRRGSAPANARRTGKPSPSRPCGAVVMLTTGRGCVAVGSGNGICGSLVMSSTVTAGMRCASLERERLYRRHDVFQVPRYSGDVDIQLDLVAVRVEDVEAVGDRVVARAHNAHARRLNVLDRVAQLVVAVADLEPEVIQPDMPSFWERLGILAHLDEQQLVVSAPAAEQRNRKATKWCLVRRLQLVPAEHVAVEGGGPLDIAHIQHEVSEFLHFHSICTPVRVLAPSVPRN